MRSGEPRAGRGRATTGQDPAGGEQDPATAGRGRAPAGGPGHGRNAPRRWGVLLASVGLAVPGAVVGSAADVAPARASASAGAITRDEVLARAGDWYARRKSLVYSTSRAREDLVRDVEGDHRYRADCSGFVSMAWHLEPGRSGGLNTGSLPDVSIRIPRSQLRPGDLLDDRVDGHAILFVGWAADGARFSYYSFGRTPVQLVEGASFEDSRWSGWPSGNYEAYRYRNVRDRASPGRDTRAVAAVDLTGDGRADVVARDGSGVLWLYPAARGATGRPVLYERVRIGAGWKDLVPAAGDVTGDGRADLVARDRDGVLWLYPGTGTRIPDRVLSSRVRIGTGWAGLTPTVADLTGDSRGDVIARDGEGVLWLYPSTGRRTADRVVSARVRVGTTR